MRFTFKDEERKGKFNWIRIVDWTLLIIMIAIVIKARMEGSYDTVYIKCYEEYNYLEEFGNNLTFLDLETIGGENNETRKTTMAPTNDSKKSNEKSQEET